MPRQSRAAPLHEQLEAVIQSRGQPGHAKCIDAARRDLDGERNSVEPPTDLRHEGSIGVGKLE